MAKSWLITNCDYITDKQRYSQLQILKSNAGYYIGTIYQNPSGFEEPGSRDSVEYYKTEEAAEYAFLHETWTQRDRP